MKCKQHSQKLKSFRPILMVEWLMSFQVMKNKKVNFNILEWPHYRKPDVFSNHQFLTPGNNCLEQNLALSDVNGPLDGSAFPGWKMSLLIDDFLSRTLKRSRLISGTSSAIYSRWCLLGPIKLNGTVALTDDDEMIQMKQWKSIHWNNFHWLWIQCSCF